MEIWPFILPIQFIPMCRTKFVSLQGSHGNGIHGYFDSVFKKELGCNFVHALGNHTIALYVSFSYPELHISNGISVAPSRVLHCIIRVDPEPFA